MAAPTIDADPLVRLIDPEGHSTVALRETRGARTFAVVLRNEVARGMATLDSVLAPGDDGDAVYRAYEGAALDCPDMRCSAQHAASLGMFASVIAERGASWHLAIVEGDRVVVRRSLVALTIHEPGALSVTPPRLRVDDVDGDSRLEVIVEVPVRPLREDTLYEYGLNEEGSVAFVLDEAALAVQAQWTSDVSLSSDGEEVGDSYEQGWVETCSRSEELQAGALVIIEGCDQRAQREVRCAYDAASDRYGCPARFAGELLRPRTRGPAHYVADDEEGLDRLLGRIGSRFDEVRARARTEAADEAAELEAERAGAPSTAAPPVAPAAPTTSPPPSCPLVVDDPAPPLHVRAEPSSRAAIVGDAPNGTRVTYLERRGRWARIEAPSAGWIWTENVRPRCE